VILDIAQNDCLALLIRQQTDRLPQLLMTLRALQGLVGPLNGWRNLQVELPAGPSLMTALVVDDLVLGDTPKPGAEPGRLVERRQVVKARQMASWARSSASSALPILARVAPNTRFW